MTSSKVTNQAQKAWFDEDPTASQIPQETRALLESYSKIPPDEVFDHVVKVRDEAWQIFPYPCIGQFRFLEPSFAELDEYDEVVARLRSGQTFLDMACCFGQTIRQLVASGAPAENILGCDLEAEFIEMGYRLYRDRETLQTRFLVADVFDAESELTRLKGQVDMVYAGSFFHLWGYEKQVKVSKVVAALLRAVPGSMILGRQVGALTAAEKTSATGTMYRHSVESFKRMWASIGDELGIKFKVNAKLKTLSSDHYGFHTDDTRRIWFVIRRC